MTTPYRPPGYSQIDGSAFAQSNCVLSITTDVIDRVTLGRLRVPAWRLRVITGDTSGGVSLQQAAEAAATATDGSVILTALYGLNRGEMRDLAVAGRPFGVVISCAVTIKTTRRTNWFTGQHAVYVNTYRWIPTQGTCGCELETTKQHGEFLCEDPGTTHAGYLWWSAELLYRAAEAGWGGPISVLVGRDTEGVSRTARARGGIRATPSTKAARKGTIVRDKAYSVIDTTTGGPWKRADGLNSHGWHRTSVGYIRGEALR